MSENIKYKWPNIILFKNSIYSHEYFVLSISKQPSSVYFRSICMFPICLFSKYKQIIQKGSYKNK